MKKRIWFYSAAGLTLAVMIAVSFKMSVQLPDFEKVNLWVARRPLPEKIALNAYLKGNSARSNHDLKQAIDAYAQVLAQDPENLSLLHDTYSLAMLQGTPELILPYLDNVKNDKLLAPYLRVAQAFKDKKINQAFDLLQHTKKKPVDALLVPLIRIWLYADQGEKEKAVAQTETLKDHPFLAGYQKVLLGTCFHDTELIRKGITQIGDHPLPAIGYFPLLKKTITETGNWERAALNKTYQQLQTTYPATAEILWQIGETDITIPKAMAEVFYLISALAGDGNFTRQESLAANSIALFLQPDKQISLVWGAELAEGIHLPKLALSYYQQMKFHSATLGFKEAAALMLLNRTQEALTKLEKLERTNKNNIPLLTLLGRAYHDTQQREKALAVYNRLIPLLEATPKNDPLIQAYLMRGILYGPQQSDQMLLDLKRAHALAPNDPMLLNDLGYHQLEAGAVDEGFDLVQSAYQQKPNDPYILDSLAFGYWKKGQANMALPLAEQALDLMPQSALINAHLGDIYAALGRHREAGFQYKKALDLKTDLTESLQQELTQKLKEKKS